MVFLVVIGIQMPIIISFVIKDIERLAGQHTHELEITYCILVVEARLLKVIRSLNQVDIPVTYRR